MALTMPKVYVVQEPIKKHPDHQRPGLKYSLDPARKYGELSILLRWNDTKAPVDSTSLTQILCEGLKSFTSKDYLVLAGHPGAIALAAMIASLKCNGLVQLLVYNRNEGEYEVWPLDLDFDLILPTEESVS